MIQRASGFSLVELMASIAVLSVISATAIAAFSNFAHVQTEIQKKAMVDETAKFSANRLTRDWQTVGGGVLRPWDSIWLEDNCGPRLSLPGCGGSDRLTLVSIRMIPSSELETFPECTILGSTGTNMEVSGTPNCCLTDHHRHTHAIVSHALNGYRKAVFINSVNLDSCTLKYSESPQLTGLNDQGSAEDGWDWNGAHLTVVTPKTYFLNPQEQNLYSWTDSNNNGIHQDEETSIITYDLHALQVALGYDSGNGIVTNTSHTDDEWLYNHPDDVMGEDGLADLDNQDLRALGFSVIFSRKHQPGQGNTINQVNWMNAKKSSSDGRIIYGVYSELYFRNTFIFK